MNISTNHQHVCSTFARHTIPTPQVPTFQKSCKRNPIQQPSRSNIFHQDKNTSAFKSLCYAQTTNAHPPPQIQDKRKL
jgi:hypothetical protein